MPASYRQSAPSFRRVNSFALYLMSLGAMIGLYSLYARFLVPVIEGPPNITRHVFQAPNVELPIQQFDRESLSGLFSQDAWEHGDCIVLATKQGLVLFQKFQRVDGGYLEVLPFTLVMKSNQESSSDGAEPPTVLRCSKGAKLKFDNPDIDPLAGKSELESAWLVGAVDIYRPASDLKKNDSIEILTSNVQFDRRQIFTIDEVQFAFGNHRGSGRQLSMEFAHQQDSLQRTGFETIAGFKRIELAYLKQLSLSPKAASPASAVANSSQGLPAPTTKGLGNGLGNGLDLAASTDSVEITCAGPFVLDLERKTATFNDKVSVLMAGATNSEILCKRLTVHFEPKYSQSNRSNPASSPQILTDGAWDLEQLVAEGSPASFVSQTHAAKVTGDVLSYNIALQEIVAQPLPKSTTPVHIVTPDFRFEARQVAYKLKPAGGLGQLIAMGPGNLLRPGTEQDRELFVQWERMLSIEPDQAQQLISVVDGCRIRFDQTTEIKSQKMQIWLDELEKKSGNPSEQIASDPESQYQPDRMTATGNVEMVSPQLNGRTERLTATWIHGDNGQNQQTRRIEPTTNGSYSRPNPPSEVTITRQRHLRVSYAGFPAQIQDGQQNSVAMQPIVRSPAGSVSELRHDLAVRPIDFQEPNSQEPNSQDTAPQKRYSFFGNEIDVKLYTAGEETAVQDLTATGDVTLSEIVDPTIRPNQLPMTIKGNQLRYVPQANDGARVVVTGLGQQLATVMTDQFRLLGNQINFDQLANKLWVEGAGEIEFNPQARAGSDAQPASIPAASRQSTYQSVKLNWASGMVFNGRKVYFEDKVNMFASGVNGSGNTIETTAFGQGVSLELNQHVHFQNTHSEAKQAIEIREVVIVNQVAGSQRVFNLASAKLNQVRDANSMLALISHKTVDPNGLELERQQFQAQQVTFQVGTGVMNSKGPGVLMHHGRGDAPLLKANNSAAGPTRAPNPLNLPGSNQGISLIRVNFDGSANATINANVNEKRLLIQGKVRTLYASVASFDQTYDPDDTVALPESAVKVKCERLDITQWTPRDADKPVQELLAAGNAHVTSGSFEATADQIRYNQADDKLVVEGTARSDAQLWHRPKATPNERQHLAAQKIIYRPGDQSYEVQEAMILDLKK